MAGASEITAGTPARGWVLRAALSPARAYALLALGVALLTWLLWSQPAADQYDNFFALAWGREIAHGSLPSENVPFAATPHPLTMLLGAPLSLLGAAHGFAGVKVIATLAWGAVVAGAALAAAAAFDLAAAVVVALLLVTNPALVQAVDNSLSDGLFAALVLAALALALNRPRSRLAVMALLGVAGLARPEAWLLAGAYGLYAGRGMRVRLALCGLALAAPLAWLALDAAATGHPLFSLTTTRDNTALVGRATGIGNVVPQLRESLGGLLDLPELIGAAAGLVLVAFRRRAQARLPVAVAVLGVAGFAALGVARLPMNPRYLLVPCVLLTVVAGYGLVEAWRAAQTRGVGWAVAAALAVVACAVLVGHQRATGLADRLDQGRAEWTVRADLSRAARRAGVRGCPVRSASYRTLSQVAAVSGTSPRGAAVTPSRLGRGVYVSPADTVARRLFPVAPQVNELVAGGRQIARTRHWVAAAVAC